jgi:hypothetical protein
MAIDYNQDIAPLRRQYFPMLVGDKGFDQAMKYRQEVIAPMQAHTLKLQQHSMQMKRQDLAYESQKLELSQARQKNQSQIKFFEKKDEVMREIDSILQNPTDSFAASKSLLQVGSKWTAEFPHSPLLTQLLTSAGRSLELDQIKKNKEEAEVAREATITRGIMSQLAQQGALEATTAAAGPDVDKFEKPYIDLAKYMEKRTLAAGVAVEEKANQKLQSDAIGKTAARYKEYETRLTSMNQVANIFGNFNFAETEEGRAEETEAIKVAADTFVLKKTNHDDLVQIYIDLMERQGQKVDPVAIRGVEQRQLYRNTLKKISQFRRLMENFGRPEAPSNASKLNDS